MCGCRGLGLGWVAHRSFFLLTEQFCILIAVVIARISTCNKIS